MRYLNIVILILLGHLVFGQRNLSVTWKTNHGIVDSGYLAKLPINLYDDYKLVFHKNYKDSITIDQENVEWVTYQGDTLLTRRYPNGRPQLMRLLYQGEIRLYRVVQPWTYRQYYLVRGGRWERLTKFNPREIGYKIIQRNCPTFNPPTRLSNDDQAIKIARQLNECIGTISHHPAPSYRTPKHQIGIVYNSIGKRASIFDDRNTRFTYKSKIIYFPTFSLQYQYQPFKNMPKLKAQLGAVFFRRHEQINTFLQTFFEAEPIPVSESWKFTLFHLYPGLNFYSGYRRKFQLSIGTGAIFTIPIMARREVRLLEGNTVPQLPINQKFKKDDRCKNGLLFANRNSLENTSQNIPGILVQT